MRHLSDSEIENLAYFYLKKSKDAPHDYWAGMMSNPDDIFILAFMAGCFYSRDFYKIRDLTELELMQKPRTEEDPIN